MNTAEKLLQTDLHKLNAIYEFVLMEKNKLFCVWNKKKACEKDVFSLFHVYADLLAGTMLCCAESHDNFKSKSFP